MGSRVRPLWYRRDIRLVRETDPTGEHTLFLSFFYADEKRLDQYLCLAKERERRLGERGREVADEKRGSGPESNRKWFNVQKRLACFRSVSFLLCSDRGFLSPSGDGYGCHSSFCLFVRPSIHSSIPPTHHSAAILDNNKQKKHRNITKNCDCDRRGSDARAGEPGISRHVINNLHCAYFWSQLMVQLAGQLGLSPLQRQNQDDLFLSASVSQQPTPFLSAS